MFPTSDASKQIVKASIGSDVRRLAVELAAGTTAAAALAAIRAAVQHGFDLQGQSAEGLVLKYMDDEGDLCTLTEHSMEDLASLSSASAQAAKAPKTSGACTWRLWAEAGSEKAPGPESAGAGDVEMSKAEGHKAAEKQGAEEPAGQGAEQSAGGGGMEVEEEGEEDGEFEEGDAQGAESGAAGHGEAFAAWAMQLLPLASMFAQSPEAKAKINAAGVEQRDTFLPVCRRLQDHLHLVPESGHLAPLCEAYISGSNPYHFGELAAGLLQCWAASPHQEGVHQTLTLLHEDIMGIVGGVLPFDPWAKGMGKGKRKGKGKRRHWGKGEGFCDGSGKGKGWGKPWADRAAAWAAAAGPWAQAGAWPPPHHWAHAAQAHTQPGTGAVGGGGGGAGGVPDFMAMLPGMLGGIMKGLGKGFMPCKGGGFAGPAGASQSSGSAGAAAAAPGHHAQAQHEQAHEQAHAEAHARAHAQAQAEAQAQQQSNFDLEVQELQEMGLVQDPDVARELLRANDGDISKVVAVLAG